MQAKGSLFFAPKLQEPYILILRRWLKPRAVVLEGDKCLDTPVQQTMRSFFTRIRILGEDGGIWHAHWPCEPWRVGFRVPALKSAPDLAGPLPASLQHEHGITMAHLVLPCAASACRLGTVCRLSTFCPARDSSGRSSTGIHTFLRAVVRRCCRTKTGRAGLGQMTQDTYGKPYLHTFLAFISG